MKIEFEKVYSYKPESTMPAIIKVPILLILAPLLLVVLIILISVILVGLIIILVWLGLGRLFSIGNKEPEIIEKEQKPYFLIEKDNFSIELVELDYEEYFRLEDYWHSDVYDEDTTLYLAKTSPEIAGLHNKVISTFMKEIKEGVLLQIVDFPGKASVPFSWIIYFEYSSLSIKMLDEIGPYFLYNNENDGNVIEGFNMGGKIHLKIKLSDWT
ncbi:hypothetical protein [Sporocytophaga myxococcoides]|uniref:hypothetical protein n=1 Tax=Sporocytophaga myxococcoides TaxID=153721 RepID=UPI0004263223|nr:hypothetical protein [Sporocytophaga myxococcoides]